jgi:transposase, IS30 family
MNKYKRLSYEERVKIETLLHQGKTNTEIADYLGRAKSTISREIIYYGGVEYQSYWANKCSYLIIRKRHFGSKIIRNPFLEYYIKLRLKQGWSPVQISQRLKEKYPHDKKMQVSHESIYTYIYIKAKGGLKKELISYLRQEKSIRKRPSPRIEKRSIIPERVGIEHRPEEVKDRIIPGHWESDLIIGKEQKSAIGTIVERTTRFAILVKLQNRTANEVRKAFTNELKELPEHMRKTLTHDNGIEMSQHKLFTKETQIQVYFANPHSPWERGTNENTNMLIRDFFPKGTDFNQVPSGKLKNVQDLLNNRPRKTLNWKTPNEVFNDYILKGKAGIAYTKDVI